MSPSPRGAPGDPRYWAFISYSHRDAAWGEWLHRALETYRLPKHLVGQPGRDGPVPRRIYPIFRDREELPTATDLTAVIEEALRRSRSLIVICSPSSAASRWVEQEVLAFKRSGRGNRILCLIVAGEPNARDVPGREADECFPDAVRFEIAEDGTLSADRTEPIAADTRLGKDARRDALLKLIAGLLGIGFDELRQRDQARRRRRAALAATVLGLLTLAFAAVSAWALAERSAAIQARNRAERAEREQRSARESEQVAKEQAIAREREALRNLAAALAERGNRALEANEAPAAEALFAKSLTLDDRPSARSGLIAARGYGCRLSWTARGPSPVHRIAWSPDGERLATADDGGVIRTWDARTGETLLQLRGHEGPAVCVAFDPEGERIISSGWDGTIRLWRATDGSEVRVLAGHTAPVTAIAPSPDGRRLASASADPDRTVRLWDLRTGEQLDAARAHKGSILAVAFGPEGKRLASGALDGTVGIWNAARLEPEDFLPGSGGIVASVAFSPTDAGLLATGGAQGVASLWNLESRQSVPLRGHRAQVTAVTFDPSGQRVMTGGFDRTVRIWENTDKASLVIGDHLHGVSSIASSPDGRRLAIATEDATVRVWDLVPREAAVLSLRGHGGAVNGIAWSPDGRLFSAGDDARLQAWDVDVARATLGLRGHEAGVLDVAVSPDGGRVASTGNDATFRIWSAKTGAQVLSVAPGNGGPTVRLAWGPDGRSLATTHLGGTTVRVWDPATGEQRLALGQGEFGFGVSFSPDGQWVAAACVTGTIRLWDAESGEERLALRGHTGEAFDIAFSPDGRQLASGGADGTVRLWDASSGGAVGVLRGHAAQVARVAYARDGRRLASVGADGTARLWDLATQNEACVLRVTEGELLTVGFSPDGRWLAYGGQDRTVRAHRLAAIDRALQTSPEALLSEAQKRTGLRIDGIEVIPILPTSTSTD